jgi:hypothetical protein
MPHTSVSALATAAAITIISVLAMPRRRRWRAQRRCTELLVTLAAADLPAAGTQAAVLPAECAAVAVVECTAVVVAADAVN